MKRSSTQASPVSSLFPAEFVSVFGLTPLGHEDALLGDGSIHPFDVYTVPPIGMSMILRHGIHIEVKEGRAVMVESLSEFEIGKGVRTTVALRRERREVIFGCPQPRSRRSSAAAA